MALAENSTGRASGTQEKSNFRQWVRFVKRNLFRWIFQQPNEFRSTAYSKLTHYLIFRVPLALPVLEDHFLV